MKLRTILLAAVMLLGISAAALAQATFQVGSIPVTAVADTGQTERTGDITFTQVSGISQLGTITISYGVPITVRIADSVRVTAPAGSPFFLNSPIILTASGTSSQTGGRIVVQVPAGVTGNGTFTVSGVRVATAGTGLSGKSLVATMSTTGNAIVAGQTSVTVINSILPGILSVGCTGCSTDVLAIAPSATYTATMRAREGFLTAFGPVGQFGDTTNTNIRFTISTAPPANVTLTFPAQVTGSNSAVWTTADGNGNILNTAVTFSSTSVAPFYVQYRLGTGTSPTATDNLDVPATLTIDLNNAVLPLPATAFTYTATLAPIGTAFTTDADGNTVVITSPIPRYAASEVGPRTLFNIIGSSTTMLIPYASTVTAGGYNTGFSFANTTMDPGETAMGGILEAIAQSGKLKFYFYPQLVQPSGAMPASFTYTTAAGSPGTGLDSSGNVPAGSTYTVLLSQLLAAAGAPADFQGYIFAVANFTNAHCLYVLSNFAGFSQGAQALIVADRTAVPEALNN